MRDQTRNGYLITNFSQMKPFSKMRLTSEAKRIQHTPNAGGSSVESETLSFELLKRYLNAQLLKTEMEVAYFPEGGSITDYVVYMFESVIGVSVTRAMKYNKDLFTTEDAELLLRKKLKGVVQSTRNSMIKWNKQILHVWTDDHQNINSLLNAWLKLETELKTNTVMLVTIAENCHEIFLNQTIKKKKKKAKI